VKDGSGIFIADTFNNAVRKVDAGGITSTHTSLNSRSLGLDLDNGLYLYTQRCPGRSADLAGRTYSPVDALQ
jgi:hypothetical protein